MSDCPTPKYRIGLFQDDDMINSRRLKEPTNHFKASRTKGGVQHSERVNCRSAYLKTRNEMVLEMDYLVDKLRHSEGVRYYWEALRLTNFRRVYKSRFGGEGRVWRLKGRLA